MFELILIVIDNSITSAIHTGLESTILFWHSKQNVWQHGQNVSLNTHKLGLWFYANKVYLLFN